ncbi:hypothetical protein B0T16DRAFT_215970 [Cercophora newfieldiana]|uniref:Heterokaryon incompatibility domain-containing protein n=1 Tax=Cercophora newfieldiana TaxID=92897 RepID=A0AA39XY60_9PEZI|nr:hypothetical protein B0T16DRAFT_215970 [Cercophora newfieldiana]
MDSICINQSDPNERNHQVRLMQKIYGLAAHVLSHIGEETPLAQKAFDAQYIELDGQLWRRWENGGLPKDVMHGLVRVLNKSQYSQRLWIIQELVLGRQVSFVTNDLIIPLPELTGGGGQTQGVLGRILHARQRWHDVPPTAGFRRGSKLVNLLEDYRSHRCQDIRDRVYGLLGVCSETIPIDYNLSPEGLFVSIMAYAIAREPKRTNGLARIDSLKESLTAALQLPLPLSEGYYEALHRQLVRNHRRSGSGRSMRKCWWYCPEGSGVTLREKLKYEPVFWDQDYDSTAEPPDLDPAGEGESWL